MEDILKPEPMATYKGPRSWAEVLASLGDSRELSRRLMGGRWDDMDAGLQIAVIRASRLESGALVGRLWSEMTLDEQRKLAEGANRCRRAADALLGAL